MTAPVNLVFAGSSFSVWGGDGSNQWNNKVRVWMPPQYGPKTYTTIARNGRNTWSNLVRLSDVLIAGTQTITIDTANDDDSDGDRGTLEAFIRRIWTYNPNIRLIGISSPSWGGIDTDDDDNVTAPGNLTQLNQAKAIFEHYGVSYAAYLDKCIELVPDTYHLNQLTDDDVHPNALGYTYMASLVEAYLPFLGARCTSSLPSRLYAYTEDFEHDPIRIDGTDYDSKTGTWTEASGVMTSSSAGATVTYSGTFRSYGIYDSVGTYATVEVSIDGGAFSSVAVQENGHDIGTRAAHTIIIKVLTTCQIDEFWAI